jgi:hypothetical protein
MEDVARKDVERRSVKGQERKGDGGRDCYRGADERVPLVDADQPRGEGVHPIRHEGGHGFFV